MSHSLLQAIRAETNRNKNPQLCTTTGLGMPRGRVWIGHGWIQRRDSNGSSNSKRGRSINEIIKYYLKVRRADPQYGACTQRQSLPQCNTERPWRGARNGTALVGVGLPIIGPLNPIGHRSGGPQNLPHQRLCVRIRLEAIPNLNNASRVLGDSPLIISRRLISTGITSAQC